MLTENEANAHFQRIEPRQIEGSGSGGAVRPPYAHWFDRPLAQQLQDTTNGTHTKCEKAAEPMEMTKHQIQHFRTKVVEIRTQKNL